MKFGRKERGHNNGERSLQGLISAKNITIELSEGRKFPYHRLTN